MNVTWNVEGMSCEHCVRAVKEAALSVEGVLDAQVDLAAKTAVIEYSEGTDLDAVKAAIEEEEFQVEA